MNRKQFLQFLPCIAAGPSLIALKTSTFTNASGFNNSEYREYWVSIASRLATPVLTNLSKGELRKNMPVETMPGHLESRQQVTHLEAFGRLMAGLAPWMECRQPGNTKEDNLQKKFIKLYLECMNHAVNPDSPDYMNFCEGGQPLVDAAFLSHALLRAPDTLFGQLNGIQKDKLRLALISTRKIRPPMNNWLLFSAMIEAVLLNYYNECERSRIDFAIEKHLEWYKGDGAYGDGPEYHWDYYNSFVIQPMMLDIVKVMVNNQGFSREIFQIIAERLTRYAAVQERMISPEGTFPPLGRSLAYRCGAFQALAQAALSGIMPEEISLAQTRCALTEVIKNCMDVKGTFDDNGWLRIGLAGHQPGIGESYISTGSLYLCSAVLLPLGLPFQHPFWTDADEEWTSKKAWKGLEIPVDHAIHN